MRVVSSTMIAAVRVTRMPALCANRTAGCPGHAHSGRTSECAVRPRGSLDRSSSYARVERSHTRRGFVVTLAMGAGGSGVLDRTLTPVKDRQRKRPPIYKVLLHNDDYNKREYVVQVLLKHVEGYTVEDALNVMREAHTYGVALVIECSQDKAESTCEAIRLCGLISTIEPR